MSNRLYIGNLDYSTSEVELRRACEAFGELSSVIVTTGKSRGFGFVEYQSASAALRASELLAGRDIGGRPISVRLEHTPRR